ncbi:MAG: lysophospholipid acyltransferase family protein [Candidatus Binatia bacterium]
MLRRRRLALVLQREIGRVLGPVWISVLAGLLRWWFGYRIERLADARCAYRRIWREVDGPLLICANHLTMIDSAIIAWALGSPWWYVRHFSALPWNMPERNNFARSPLARILAYIMKCLPVTRGGPRIEVMQVVHSFIAVLANGHAGLIFPEGGRSRTGRVDIERAAYGVGRIVRELPGCRVLCVYLRGAHQTDFSDLPAHSERFRVAVRLIAPTSAVNGLRGDREITRRIVEELADMERQYFDGR